MVEGSPGNFATVCVGQRECVFVYYEGGIARCVFEKVYLEGITTWRKPLSCHLFPIRIKRGNVDYLHYERIRECEAGRERGKLLNVALAQFLRDALTRKYGKDWFEKFLSASVQVNNS